MEGDKKYRVSVMGALSLLSLLMLFCASGASADGNVTMESLTIFKTHEWFGRKPTVYFRCGQERKVFLPDVTKKDETYYFRGQESWQPLTTLYGEKCKRCGLYEQDTVKSDDTFYEAELCPRDFIDASDGRLVLSKAKEFNATLVCPDCIPQSMDSNTTNVDNSGDDEGDDKGGGVALFIVLFVFIVLFALGVVAYTKWRQKQRREQQARFVKMFEDDDDLDEELGLKDEL